MGALVVISADRIHKPAIFYPPFRLSHLVGSTIRFIFNKILFFYFSAYALTDRVDPETLWNEPTVITRNIYRRESLLRELKITWIFHVGPKSRTLSAT